MKLKYTPGDVRVFLSIGLRGGDNPCQLRLHGSAMKGGWQEDGRCYGCPAH